MAQVRTTACCTMPCPRTSPRLRSIRGMRHGRSGRSTHARCYTGGSSGIQVGATIGIPSTVNLPSLGLTADGLAVATALQNYGAMPRATGGTSEFISYAEQAADDSGCCSTQMNNIRDDLRKIMPYFRILRNRRPNSINGGGLREVQSRPA